MEYIINIPAALGGYRFVAYNFFVGKWCKGMRVSGTTFFFRLMKNGSKKFIRIIKHPQKMNLTHSKIIDVT